MILQTIVLLNGVIGASYVLASASWQVVLFAFMCSGIGYALWQTIKAFQRRAKIREFWHRSVELEPLLDELDEDSAYDQFIQLPPKNKSKVKQKRMSVVRSSRSSNVSKFPIQQISQQV